MGARTGLVTGRRTGKQRERGTDVRLLQVMLTDKSDVQTVQLIEQCGEESNPVNGTMIAVLPGAFAAKFGIAAEDGIPPIMGVGGKRIYAIDPVTHTVICQIQLIPDGTVTVSNGAASFTMNPDGTFSFNGTGTTFNHTVNMPEAVINGVAFTTHIHGGVQTGAGTTGGPQ